MPTVLCIDDHTYSLTCMREMLRAHGYEVLWAESAPDAIGFLLQNTVDALLLDCTSSGDKSQDFLAVVEKLDIPIVMMPDYCSMPCHSLHRADTCRQKGETSRALLQILEIVISARRYGSLHSVAARSLTMYSA
jgi:response regulator RpfG family c-di-GMP phosphodiesterase